jgi:hypothetical protein
MRTLTYKCLLILGLALASLSANADERFDNRYRFNQNAGLEWRLGAFLGGYRGYEIMYRAPDSRRWIRAPGNATAVGDGWVLGTDRHAGGYGIYRWNGYGWDRAPGTAVRIGGTYRQPWVINDRNIRYEWNGYDWREAGYAGRNAFNGNSRFNRNDRDNRRFDDRDRNDRRRDNDRNNSRDDRPRWGRR